jgi:hypothetical protein
MEITLANEDVDVTLGLARNPLLFIGHRWAMGRRIRNLKIIQPSFADRRIT